MTGGDEHRGGPLCNGVLISKAVLVNERAAGLTGAAQQKGFTDMAHAVILAENMFLLGGCQEAMGTIVTLADGKPLFLSNTVGQVPQMKDELASLMSHPRSGEARVGRHISCTFLSGCL